MCESFYEKKKKKKKKQKCCEGNCSPEPFKTHKNDEKENRLFPKYCMIVSTNINEKSGSLRIFQRIMQTPILRKLQENVTVKK